MMGFPCLRLDGDFFASCDHRTGELVVKLDEQRARALIDAGKTEPFAPNGRRFREWATVPHERLRSWQPLLEKRSTLPRLGNRLHEGPDERATAPAELTVRESDVDAGPARLTPRRVR